MRIHRFTATAGLIFVIASPGFSADDGLDGTDFPAPAYRTDVVGERLAGVGDFDGDGHLDLMTYSPNAGGPPASGPSGSLAVLWGDGNGGFLTGERLSNGSLLGDALVGDIDGDGDDDVVVRINFGAVTYAAFENLGSRQFVARDVTAPGIGPGTFRTLADLNGDGRAELLVNGFQSVTVTELGIERPWTRRAVIPTTVTPRSIAVADADGDGVSDIVAPLRFQPEVAIAFIDPAGVLDVRSYILGMEAREALVAEVDGDGIPDLVTLDESGDHIRLLRGTGNRDFAPEQVISLGVSANGIASIDTTGDGLEELIALGRIGSSGPSGFEIIGSLAHGAAPSSEIVQQTGFLGPGVAADLNEDGRPDLILGGSNNFPNTVLYGAEGGGFERPGTFDVPVGSTELFAGEFSGSGRRDLVSVQSDVVPSGGGNSYTVHLCGPDGQFAAGVPVALDLTVFDGACRDLNGDGSDDLILLGEGTQVGDEMRVLLADGLGGFTETFQVDIPDVSLLDSIDVADFDGDGLEDIVLCLWRRSLQLHFGTGAGQFTSAFQLTGSPAPDSAAAIRIGPGERPMVASFWRAPLGPGQFGFMGMATDYRITPSREALATTGPLDLDGVGSVRAIDVDGDQRDEVFMALGEIDVLLRFDGEAGAFAVEESAPGVGATESALAVDVNLDGADELLTLRTTSFTPNLEVRDLASAGLGGPRVSYLAGERVRAVATVDVNQDSNPDLAVLDGEGSRVHVYVNRAGPRLDVYCTSAPNSTGSRAEITASGSRSLAGGDLELRVRGLPPMEALVWFTGAAPGARVVSGGTLCIGGRLRRMSAVKTATGAGTESFVVPAADLGLVPGAHAYFQCWYRDIARPLPGFGFSDAVTVLFCP